MSDQFKDVRERLDAEIVRADRRGEEITAETLRLVRDELLDRQCSCGDGDE
jgi:hypothetical protein